MDKELSSLGFEEASNIIFPRLVMSISGLPKQGKTHFALTAPGDIALFNADIGLEGVVHKFTSRKKIYQFDFSVPGEQVQAKRDFDKLSQAWEKVIKNKKIRTVIADTETDIWELKRMASFGKLTQVMPHHYSIVNAEYRAFLKKIYSSPDTNLILLHKMKKTYVQNKDGKDGWNGKYERAGFGDMGFLVQVNARVWRDEEDGDFHIYITDCRQNPDLAGEDLFGPLCTFPMLAQMILPESNIEDWE